MIEDMEKIREEFKGEEATKGRFTFGQVFDYINDGRGGSGIQKRVRPGSGCGYQVMCATSC